MASIWFLGSTDLQQFIITVVSSGIVGAIISWVLERVPGWNEPPKWLPLWLISQWPRIKRWTVFAVAVALPFLVTIFVYGAGPDFIGLMGVWASLTMQGLVIWLFTQAAHVVDPARMIELIKLAIQLGPVLLKTLQDAQRETAIEKSLKRLG